MMYKTIDQRIKAIDAMYVCQDTQRPYQDMQKQNYLQLRSSVIQVKNQLGTDISDTIEKSRDFSYNFDRKLTTYGILTFYGLGGVSIFFAAKHSPDSPKIISYLTWGCFGVGLSAMTATFFMTKKVTSRIQKFVDKHQLKRLNKKFSNNPLINEYWNLCTTIRDLYG